MSIYNVATTLLGGTVEPRLLLPQQLSTIPIEAPDPAASAYGMMTWDLPSAVAYVPYQEVTAIMEVWNPTDVNRLYGITYYFIDPQGTVVIQDYLYFTAGGMNFASFILHAGAPAHMITTVVFKAPGVGYKFGLRLLELEMIGSEAFVKYETSRLEVLLGSTGQTGDGGIIGSLLSSLITVSMVGMMGKMMSDMGRTEKTAPKVGKELTSAEKALKVKEVLRAKKAEMEAEAKAKKARAKLAEAEAARVSAKAEVERAEAKKAK